MCHPRLALPGLVLLLLAVACTDGDLPTDPLYAGDAVHSLSDGAHDGTEGFYFLPPLVRNPDHAGTFDANLTPIVEICETTACADLHEIFTMTQGVGSEIVRLDEQNEHYVVNWHTDRSGPNGTGTEVGQTYRIRVQVAGTVLGYADVEMTGTGREARNTTTDGVIGLVDGRTLPIRFRIEEGAVLVVGSEGGTFVSNDGAVTLEVPAGAVEGDIGIIVSPANDGLDDPDVVPGLAFAFFPSPYSFAEPVTLTVAYDPSSLPSGIPEEELRLLAFEGDEWVQLPGSSVNPANSTVSGPLESFSRKAVGRGKVHAIAVSPADASIGVGETQQFEATVTNVDGEVMSRNVQWSSSDEAVATVDNTGLATSVALGESTIEARSGKVRGSAVLAVEVGDGHPEIMAETITGGALHSCGLSVSGQAYCWGGNNRGQLGDGSFTDRGTPVAVNMPEGVRLASITAGREHTVALSTSGVAYAWGLNDKGQLGNGSTDFRTNTPTLVSMPAGVTFISINAAQQTTAALSSTGSAYTWGNNHSGQLGDGTTTDRNAPVAVVMPSGVAFSSISTGPSSAALSTTGFAYAWGSNSYGQLGDGTTTNRAVPVMVNMPAGVTFTSISTSYLHTVALSTTGEAFAWGRNNSGEVGDGTTTARYSPVAVSMPPGVSFGSIRAGQLHTVALSITGTAYAWGRNDFGQLGDGTLTNRHTPVAVSMPQGVSFVAIGPGERHTLALSAAGIAYQWGRFALRYPVAVAEGITFAH